MKIMARMVTLDPGEGLLAFWLAGALLPPPWRQIFIAEWNLR
jgi:hypothetical protein